MNARLLMLQPARKVRQGKGFCGCVRTESPRERWNEISQTPAAKACPEQSRRAPACESPARKCRVKVGKTRESRRDGTNSHAHSFAERTNYRQRFTCGQRPVQESNFFPRQMNTAICCSSAYGLAAEVPT